MREDADFAAAFLFAYAMLACILILALILLLRVARTDRKLNQFMTDPDYYDRVMLDLEVERDERRWMHGVEYGAPPPPKDW